MSSGIKLTKDISDVFEAVKSKHKHKAVFLKLNDANTEIVIDRVCDTMCFDELKRTINEGYLQQPVFIIYDHICKNGNTFLVMINWCTDECPIKKKMTFASTKDTVKKAADGFGFHYNPNDMDDFEGILEDMEKRKKT